LTLSETIASQLSFKRRKDGIVIDYPTHEAISLARQFFAMGYAAAHPDVVAQAVSKPVAWQWRYVGHTEWLTPSGGRKITPEELKREQHPIEQRPLYAAQPPGAELEPFQTKRRDT
jgi:hypothetical protein